MQKKKTGFTPEQILKGMECCRDVVRGDCENCPYIITTSALDLESCVDTMMDDARELIISLLHAKGEAHGYRKQSENTVEVVRCKDCKEWQRHAGFVDSPNGHCFCHDIDTNGFDFCSYGSNLVDLSEGRCS